MQSVWKRYALALAVVMLFPLQILEGREQASDSSETPVVDEALSGGSFLLVAQVEHDPTAEAEAQREHGAAEDEAAGEGDEGGAEENEAAPEGNEVEAEGGEATAPAPEPATEAGPSSAEVRQGALDASAQARAAVGVPPLVWSDSLAAYAQEWADNLKATNNCRLKHRQGQDSAGYGENLFATSGRATAAEAVNSWVAERARYDAATYTCAAGESCGHYTQVVWRATTEVGCASAQCEGGNQVWVCNYSPAGNVQGEKPY